MEKPKAPSPRQRYSLQTEAFQGCFYVSREWDEILVSSAEEAEMLIHALAEWIEYKRQLELWNRESAL